MKRKFVYPFPAVIGQEKVKKALILNVINPNIGGVLISGEKGTAKSTVVRGLADLIPQMEIVEMPLNTTEDRLIGSINIEHAIFKGEIAFESGILKKAHKNILYVDEVNLLSEHIVNCLLETSASGVNRVEREGLSHTHDSKFVLVGTMNPEEGMLRSQFLDRFGIFVEVTGSSDSKERIAIISKRLEYEVAPENFMEKHRTDMNSLSEKILNARNRLPEIKVTESVMQLASRISMESNCAGHRAEIIIVETAKAIAAFDGRKNITAKDIKEAASYALPHRVREMPPQQSPEEDPKEQEQQEQEDNAEGQENNPQEDSQEEEPQEQEQQPENQQDEQIEKEMQENNQEEENDETPEQDQTNNSQGDQNNIEDNIEDIGDLFSVQSLNLQPLLDRKKRNGSGKRSKTKTDSVQGRYVRYVLPKNQVKDLAFDATLRAAAPFQNTRDKNGLALAINSSDFREKVREKRMGNTILFVVDASGSMGVKQRMKAVKGAIMSLLTDAYQKRDKVGMVAFRKKGAEYVLGITRSVDLAQKCLKELPTGGKTPLAEGMHMAYEILKAEKAKDPDTAPLLVLISDGRANVSLNDRNPYEEAIEVAKKIKFEGIHGLVIDSEKDFIRLGLAQKVSEAMNADYCKLEDLEADQIAHTIRSIM
ncbi:magnesium chelatase subunit D family protein [uncultured Ilyobacter sp.]|uniref:magnesium chelatase subunit D family protein n=1 Tax=uncultured Ilyobacter sp. TaxID=544433 RepID=UPI0029C8CA3D|nr:magnesium chelatase subunit D family protein [uncultured Ilyobacter sp.]